MALLTFWVSIFCLPGFWAEAKTTLKPNPQYSPNWGIKVHQDIAFKAIYTLPKELFAFYKAHELSISRGAGMPDIRRIKNKEQSPWHYTEYIKYSTRFQDTIPKNLDTLEQKLGFDSAYRWGIVPWHINRLSSALERAFIERNTQKIVWLSSELAHFTADLCVPLHNTSDYDGRSMQFSGLHKAWETTMPANFERELPHTYQKAKYLPDIWKEVWNNSRGAHLNWLKMKEQLNNFPVNKRNFNLNFDASGRSIKKMADSKAIQLLHQSQWPIMAMQYKKAIELTASVWYTVWVNAGMPGLSKDTPFNWSDDELKKIEAEFEQWKVRQWDTDPCGN